MGLVFEILLPLVFYLVYYCHKGFAKPFAGLFFIFLGSKRKNDGGGGGAERPPSAGIGLKKVGAICFKKLVLNIIKLYQHFLKQITPIFIHNSVSFEDIFDFLA